ncbi:hypothetical protein C8Q75DRAFT_754187 [Abortiporus biennis]|nr:hypothetical protein C8Q75DRAFT_754187 [Abortiporus biennis]
MHSALLIDEILQTIFDQCEECYPFEYLAVMYRLATMCKDWREPTLDRVWKKLFTISPLLELLNETSSDGKEVNSYTINDTFKLYAKRVKEVTLRRKAPLLLSDDSSPILSNLSTATINDAGCFSPPEWFVTPALRTLYIRTGPNVGGNDPEKLKETCKNVAEGLSQLVKINCPLQKLRVRGWMSPQLDLQIGRLCSLRYLTLHTWESVSSQTIYAVASFPHLELFQLHAGHIDGEDFLISRPGHLTKTFPSLRFLHLRGRQSLFKPLLDLLTEGKLETLYLETEYPVFIGSMWRPVFETIAQKASSSLLDLTIDNFVEMSEFERRDTLIPTEFPLNIDIIRPLSSVRNLKRFYLDVTVPPILYSEDVEEMGKWWTKLEYMDLTRVPLHAVQWWWQPKVTFAVLPALARTCPNLQTLALALDIDNTKDTSCSQDVSSTLPSNQLTYPSHPLQFLRVGYSHSTEQLPSFVNNVFDLFPNVELDCSYSNSVMSTVIKPTMKEKWLATHFSPLIERGLAAGTEDGFADGGL